MSFIIIISLYLATSILLKNSIVFFERFKILDHPSKRSNHNFPKPKGAGLILIPLLIFATLLVFFLEDIINSQWIVILGFCSILMFISLLDDLKNVSLKLRLMFQVFCVISSIILLKDDFNIYFKSMEVDIWKGIYVEIIQVIVLFLFATFWVWIINLFNFMDGMDGITVVQASSLAICSNYLAILGLIEINFLYFSLIILAILMAFFSVNKPPAKIFLGDVGSIPIGFLAGYLIIYNEIKSDLFIPFIIIIMYYLLDSSITLVLRFFKRENIFEAHSSHFYQKIIRKGFSHNYVLKRIIGLNIVLLVLSYTSIQWPTISIITAIALTISLLLFFEFRKQK